MEMGLVYRKVEVQLSKHALKTKADLLFWTVISYHRSVF